MKIFFATSRPVGYACRAYLQEYKPELEFVPSPEKADIIISVLYDRLFKPKELEGKKAFNYHPGILPEYAGSGTVTWALLNEERELGVTLHEIDDEIDHGDIVDILIFPIGNDETAVSAWLKMEAAIRRLFENTIDSLLNGTYESYPQDFSQRKVYYRKDLEDLKNLTPLLRALYFPGKEGAYFYEKGSKIYIEYEAS